MYPKIDSYNLRLFAATARAGSIAKAAKDEHIAPSALSRRMTELEDLLRTPLFVRSTKGLELTDAGAALLVRVKRINDEMHALVREAWNLSKDNEIRGVVRLWTNPSGLIGYLPELLRSFLDAHPSVEVEITEDDTSKVIRACMEDDADIGIGVAQDVPPGLEQRLFVRDPLHVICTHGHPLTELECPITLAHAIAHPLLSVRLGGALDSILRMRAQQLSEGVKPRLTVSSIDAACRLVEVGLGVAVLPAAMLKTYAGTGAFASFPLAEDWASRSLSVYAVRKLPRPVAIAAMIEHLARVNSP